MKFKMQLAMAAIASSDAALVIRSPARHRAALISVSHKSKVPTDRLADDCEEPDEEGYGEGYSGSFGPEKIFCCKTAQKTVADIKQRCEEDCTDGVPCWKTMQEKWCGVYLEKYEDMEAERCKARPTTTSTTTTTVATTTVATTTAAVASTTVSAEDPLEWCYKLCGEVAQSNKCQDPESCKTFCRQASERFANADDTSAENVTEAEDGDDTDADEAAAGGDAPAKGEGGAEGENKAAVQEAEGKEDVAEAEGGDDTDEDEMTPEGEAPKEGEVPAESKAGQKDIEKELATEKKQEEQAAAGEQEAAAEEAEANKEAAAAEGK